LTIAAARCQSGDSLVYAIGDCGFVLRLLERSLRLVFSVGALSENPRAQCPSFRFSIEFTAEWPRSPDFSQSDILSFHSCPQRHSTPPPGPARPGRLSFRLTHSFSVVCPAFSSFPLCQILCRWRVYQGAQLVL